VTQNYRASTRYEMAASCRYLKSDDGNFYFMVFDRIKKTEIIYAEI